MAGKVKGITIEFRGDTTQLSRAINQVRNESKSLDKELGYINKSLKFDPKNVDLWKQKQIVLNDAVKQGKNNLESLKRAQAELDSSGVDRNSDQYRELEREIIKCENKLKDYNKELRQIPSAQVRALAEGFKEVGKKMTDVGKTLSTKVTAPLVAMYTLSANLGSDYEENLNKIDVAFGESGEAVKEWASNVREQFGLSKVQATQAVSSFGALGKGIGLTEEQASEMSMTLAGLSADLGSYFNVGTDESSKALEGIFTGESEALKKFGVVMTDTNLKQFAEDQGLVWSELDQTQKTMVRYQYVLEKTRDAQGDFARTNDGTANSTKIFKASIQDLGTAIGTQLLPIITPVIQKVANFVSKLADLPEPVQKIITVIGLVVAGVGPLLLIIGSLASAIGTLMTVIPMVTTALAGVSAPILPIVAGIGLLIGAGVFLLKHWDDVKYYAGVLKDWVVEKWTALKDGVVNTVTDLVNKVKYYWEALKLGLTIIITAIKTTISNTWESIKSAVANVVNTISTTVSNVFNGLKNTASNIFNGIKSTAVSVWNGIKDAIQNPINTAVTFVKNAIDKIKGFFSGLKLELPHIKLPHFKLSGSFSLAPPSVPKLSIDWYKDGAIFNRPTIFPNGVGIGDVAGGEAVLPLRKFWDEMDSRSMGTNITINVNASPGMDINELVKEIERKLITNTKRQNYAWR